MSQKPVSLSERTPARKDVYDLLKTSEKQMSLQEISSACGKTYNRTRQLIERLINDGLVKRVVIPTGRVRNKYLTASSR